MKLDAAKESTLMEKSQKLGISFSCVLQAYVVENLLRKITKSSYKEVIWLLRDDVIGQSAYENGTAGRLDMIYMESTRKIPEHQMIPGQRLSEMLAGYILEEFFVSEDRSGIEWEIRPLFEEDGSLRVHVIGKVDQMAVPVELCIRRLKQDGYVPQKKELAMLTEPTKCITYYLYPLENILAEHFIEIMQKLELITDMESYAVVNELLQALPVSGRHMLEILEVEAQKHPAFRKVKRFDQLRSYRNYAYMRKRWMKYSNHHERDIAWEDVMDRLLLFTEPIWHAFCEGEVFLDDWMPELGRFLG